MKIILLIIDNMSAMILRVMIASEEEDKPNEY